MTATIGLVLDCADPHHLAEFWSSALGYRNAGAAGSYVVRRGSSWPTPRATSSASATAAGRRDAGVDLEIRKSQLLVRGDLRVAADVWNVRQRDLAGITVRPLMRALRSIAAAGRWRPLGRSAGQSRRDA